MNLTPRLKVCCIQDVDEARLAVELGASAIGLVSAMPSGPGPIAEERIGAIARSVPPGIATFLLTALVDARAIAAQHARCGTTTIQLVDRLEPSERLALRRALPGVEIVQVVHVAGPESLDEAREAAEHSHALLLDSGNRAAALKELGGTGRTHDWELSARIVAAARVPVWLAGGPARPQRARGRGARAPPRPRLVHRRPHRRPTRSREAVALRGRGERCLTPLSTGRPS